MHERVATMLEKMAMTLERVARKGTRNGCTDAGKGGGGTGMGGYTMLGRAELTLERVALPHFFKARVQVRVCDSVAIDNNLA
jgi:hypothetical protein